MRLWAAWFRWVTLGETVGFCVPAVVGTVTAGAPAAVTFPALLVAGAVEGAILGWAQAHVLRRALPSLRVSHWATATSAAAVLAYAIGLAPSTFDITALPQWTWFVLGATAGLCLLLSIGVAQWLILRRFIVRAFRWVWITAGAWLAGLAVFMLIATPLWHEGQSVGYGIIVGVVAGLAMAATVAAVTGLGLVRLGLGTSPTAAPALDQGSGSNHGA